MNIQRFVGSSNHDVMRQVRLALGPEALIISSRRTDAGVEIFAADADAVDEEGRLAIAPDAPDVPDVPDAVAVPAAVGGASASTSNTASAIAPAGGFCVGAGAAPVAGQATGVMAAIDSLRGLLENRIDSMAWDANLRRAPVSATLFQTLLTAGFSTPLLHAMLTRLPASLDHAAALIWARNELITHLPVMRHEDDLLGEGGVFALVGPTGVGKTTTIAKLAARCVLRVGADRVAMLTTDSYRIGAYEQLQIYGRLMRVPVHSASDLSELRQTLNQIGERDIVLIDNVGISQRDRYVAEQAAMLCAVGRRVRRLLVLNAASHGDTLDEVARAYRGEDEQALEGCIITKLDEAPRLGAVLDTAIRHRLPVHYVSHGQKVPEHLSLARGPALIDRALSQAGEGKALYAPSEADLGALWASAQSDASAQTQDQTAGQHRRQLLLSALAGGAMTAGAQHLDQAIDWLQRDPAAMLTRELAAQDMTADAALTRLTDAARAAFAPLCQSHLLAVHGRTVIKDAGAGVGASAGASASASAGNLASAILMSDRGEAIAAPCQQLLTPWATIAAWLMPDERAEQSEKSEKSERYEGLEGLEVSEGLDEPLSVVDALQARVARLAHDYPQRPLAHLLEGGTPRLWQQLSDVGAAWLTRVGGAARVIQDDGSTTAQALARTLLHAPVPDTVARPHVLWAAEASIRSAVRNDAPLRLVSVRAIDKATGTVAARLYGLSNLAVSEANTSRLASWLAHQHTVRSTFRFMSHAWQAVALQEGVAGLRRQTLVAGQLGLTSWQVATLSSAEPVRWLLKSLAGSGTTRRLPVQAIPSALLRLFALLEMAG